MCTLCTVAAAAAVAGKPRSHTWTRLDGSVSAGATSITLEAAVDWVAGDEIIIATTGDRFSTIESEQRTIASVSGTTLTLTEPLEYGHLGEDISFTGNSGTVTLPARAEVGLLTRNIKFMGSNDAQWNDVIEACPDGFDPGMRRRFALLSNLVQLKLLHRVFLST